MNLDRITRYVSKYPILITICMLFISACATSPAENATPAARAQVNTSAPTQTPSVDAHSSASAEIPTPIVPEPTQTSTLTVSATLTPTRLPTLTPLPTISAEELETTIDLLYEDPMNCDVPCWWGAIPGQTTLEEVRHFFAPYNLQLFDRYDTDERKGPIEVFLGVEQSKPDIFNNHSVRYYFEDSILTSIVSSKGISIDKILHSFGAPDEVWLSTFDNYYNFDTIPFGIDMLYFDKGIAVVYVADGQLEDQIVEGCFAEGRGDINLFRPLSVHSHEDFYLYSEDIFYRPLEDTTDLTIEDFVRHFGQPETGLCIQTPAEKWKR